VFDLMNEESLLFSKPSEINSQRLTVSAVSAPSTSHDEYVHAHTASMSADAAQRTSLDLPILRIVMKTRMSVAESKYEDLCFLNLDNDKKGTGIVRGLPVWLTEQQQDIFNDMLRDFDSRSQLPYGIGDRELMQPWFNSMHDSAGVLQEKEVSRR
jgi:hypothetical protein